MKAIGLYGLQILVGLVALAAGYAKLTGMGFMAEPFAMIALGKTFLMVAGTVEILAGLCLLFPRSGAVGAVLLVIVMFGTIGASVGIAVSRHGDGMQFTVSRIFRTAVQNSAPMAPAVVVKASQGWDI
jgi:uncharacterized membrane protein YphA (DoxX/SURF4 family)